MGWTGADRWVILDTVSDKRQTHREVGTQSHGALGVSRVTERHEVTMDVITTRTTLRAAMPALLPGPPGGRTS